MTRKKHSRELQDEEARLYLDFCPMGFRLVEVDKHNLQYPL